MSSYAFYTNYYKDIIIIPVGNMFVSILSLQLAICNMCIILPIENRLKLKFNIQTQPV